MRFYISLIAILFTAQVFAQQLEKVSKTIDYQFKTLYKKSNSYKVYKMISKDSYNRLHNSVLDSINNFNKKLTAKNIIIDTQKNTIEDIKKIKQEIEIRFKEAIAKENSILFFGTPLRKQLYIIIMLGIIFTLVALLIYFIYRFINRNILAVQTKKDLIEVEYKFNTFKKKSLDREQKLRRELQDEINKNRNN